MPGRDRLSVGEALLDNGRGRVLDEIVHVAGIEKPFAVDLLLDQGMYAYRASSTP